MKQVDLGPGEYTERKPKGWRWRLPWSHPEDAKLQFIGMLAGLVGLGYVFINRDDLSSGLLFGGAAVCGVIVGGLFALAFRDF